MKPDIARRTLLAGAAATLALTPIAACAQSPRVFALSARRDPGCGCCLAWSAAMQRTGRFTTTMANDLDMATTKQRLGVPAELASCHTAEVEGYVIEGHVPAREILRLLGERPRGVRGLAVPGMPIGSPGMEAANGAVDGFDVIAFQRDGGRSVYARYPGSS